MSLLVPLGLLGLAGIIALILIYIIKPNFQNKFISSTYIWKLSLKYKKKSVPINRIRNILIFLCQLLILTACALLLAQPAIQTEKVVYDTEKVVIIDASASMRVKSDDGTRFERAVKLVKDYSLDVANSGGVMSVILADGDSHFIVQKVSAANNDEVIASLDELLENEETSCSYGSADMEGAVELAEEILLENPETEVILYTATTYIEKGGINVVNVADEEDWNVAVTDCRAVTVDNYYTVEADIGCYGKSLSITVFCRVTNVNGSGKDLTINRTEKFDPTQAEQTIIFDSNDLAYNGEGVYSFEDILVYVEEEDSFADDNNFRIFGGIKPDIKILYYSSLQNDFVLNVLLNMRSLFTDKWNISITEKKNGESYVTEGYDFYIYEHRMPDKLPTDGVSVLLDPDVGPQGSGLNIGQTLTTNRDTALASGMAHPLTRLIKPTNITVSQYKKIITSDGYDALMYCKGSPVYLVRNDEQVKCAVMAFSFHYSNLPVIIEFPMLFYNLFNYFIPSTFSHYAYEVGDTVTLNARGEKLSVKGPDIDEEYTAFPQDIVVTRPGAYTLVQDSLRTEEPITEMFWVGISAYESNITKEDDLPSLTFRPQSEDIIQDLLVYFAAALVALLFIEWFLQSREYLR